MPSTPTVLAGVSRDATFSATWVSASASVTSGRLVLVPFGCGWGAGPTSLSSITSTFAIQGSWTVVVESDPYGSRECIAGWAWAIADETASGTVTTTWANSFGQIKWGAVLEIASDFDSTTPARAQTNDSNGAATLASDTDLTGTLGSAPLSSSVVLMSLFGREGIAASTFISGFTSLSTSAGDNATYGTAYAAGSNGAGYGGQFSVAMGAGAVVAAIEIQEPSGTEITSSGTPAAQDSSTSGTAERELTGSGTPASQAASMSGAAERVLTCSGSLTSAASSVSGTATLQLKLLLTAAQGRELRDEDGVVVANLASIAYEWYDKDTDTQGNPVDSGTFSTNASGEATIQLSSSTLNAGEFGLLVLTHPTDNTIRGVYRIPVT